VKDTQKKYTRRGAAVSSATYARATAGAHEAAEEDLAVEDPAEEGALENILRGAARAEGAD
jgi:hypothetical protein